MLKDKSQLVAVIVIVVVGITVYCNSLFNGFVGDDSGLIVNNPLVHSLSNVLELFKSGGFYDYGAGHGNNYYRPIVSLVYLLIYAVFGENPFPYHLLQIILHISNAVLFLFVLSPFFKKRVAILFVLIFLVHPINVEAVANISSMQDTLFVLFGLSALLLVSKEKDRTWFFSFTLGTVLMLMSFLSKESGFLFVAILPLFGFILKKHVKRHTVQAFVATCIYGVLRFVIAKIYFNQVVISPIMTAPFGLRMINMPKVVVYYIETFIFPMDISALQDWVVTSIDFSSFYYPLIRVMVFLGLLLALVLVVYKRNRNQFNVLAFFSMWFVFGLSIHTQLVPLDQTVADRWFYFPIMGLLGIMAFATEFFKLDRYPKIFYTSLVIILLVLSARSVVRNTNWMDNSTLCTHDIGINGRSALLEGCVGYELFLTNELVESEKHFLNATKLFPSGNTWANLGNFYYHTKRFHEASQAYDTALIYGSSPKAHLGLIRVHLATEDFRAAEKYAEGAMMIYPNYIDLRGYLAFIKYKLGDKQEAIYLADSAYELSGDIRFQQLLENIKNDKVFIIK